MYFYSVDDVSFYFCVHLHKYKRETRTMVDLASGELLVLVFLSVLFVGIGLPSMLVRSSKVRKQYMGMQRPFWAPPPWIFGVAWLVLYALQSVAYWRVRLDGNWTQHLAALLLFVFLQLFLAAYTLLFVWFLWASAVIVLVSLGLAIATTVLFWSVEVLPGILMLILVLWLAFATVLALSVAFMNRKPKKSQKRNKFIFCV